MFLKTITGVPQMLNNSSELYSLDKTSTKWRKKKPRNIFKEDIYVSSLEQMIRNPPCGKICQSLYHNTTRAYRKKRSVTSCPKDICLVNVVWLPIYFCIHGHFLSIIWGLEGWKWPPTTLLRFSPRLKRGRKISEEREIVSWILNLVCNTQQWYINIEDTLPTLSIKKFPERMKEGEVSATFCSSCASKIYSKGSGKKKKKGGGGERR